MNNHREAVMQHTAPAQGGTSEHSGPLQDLHSSCLQRVQETCSLNKKGKCAGNAQAGLGGKAHLNAKTLSQITSTTCRSSPLHPGSEREDSGSIPACQAFTRWWLDLAMRGNQRSSFSETTSQFSVCCSFLSGLTLKILPFLPLFPKNSPL